MEIQKVPTCGCCITNIENCTWWPNICTLLWNLEFQSSTTIFDWIFLYLHCEERMTCELSCVKTDLGLGCNQLLKIYLFMICPFTFRDVLKLFHLRCSLFLVPLELHFLRFVESIFALLAPLCSSAPHRWAHQLLQSLQLYLPQTSPLSLGWTKVQGDKVPAWVQRTKKVVCLTHVTTKGHR